MYLHEYGILGCKIFSEITSGVGAIGSINEFPGGSCSHDVAPLFTPARPEINDIVRLLDDLHVVFDDGNRVALLHEFLKHGSEPLDIVDVESRGGQMNKGG